MRVLIVNQAFFPDTVATSQHAWDFARFLVAEGHEVAALASDRPYGESMIHYPPYEVKEGIEIHRVRSWKFKNRLFLVRAFESLRFLWGVFRQSFSLKKADVVLVLTSPPLVGLLLIPSVWIRRSRLVLWLMDMNPEVAIAAGYLSETSFPTRLLKSMARFLYRSAHRIIALDPIMRERVIRYGVDPERVVNASPWSSIPIQEPEGVSSTYREALGCAGKTVVMYAGNHSVVHPVETVLEVALKLKDDERFRFIFVGSGARVREVKDFAKRNQLTNLVQMPHQPRENLEDLLKLADIHVAILGEKLSGIVHLSKIYGIIAAGKPCIVVAPEASHLEYLLNQCPYGARVNHGDAQGFVAALHRLADLPESERERMRIQSQGWLRDHGTSEAVTARLWAKIA